MLDRNPVHLLRVLLLLLLSLASLSASAALERIRGTHTETGHGVAWSGYNCVMVQRLERTVQLGRFLTHNNNHKDPSS